jgi:hypothetical protein
MMGEGLRRTCRVYLRKNDTLVSSAAMTTHGFEIDDVPIFRLDADQPDAAIGKAVLQALNSYRWNVSPPGPEGRHPDPVLEFAEVKSWRQLEKGSRNIFIREKDGSITAIPTRRPPEGGYDHLNELAVHCRAIPEEIGAAVRQAALLCS